MEKDLFDHGGSYSMLRVITEHGKTQSELVERSLLFALAFGVFGFFIAPVYRVKIKNKKMLICPRCENVFEVTKDLAIKRCDKCVDSILVALEGFYDKK